MASRILAKFWDYDTGARLRRDADIALANSNPILIRRGLIDGASLEHKFGRNAGVPNGSWEGVLQVAAQFPWLTAPTKVRVKSGGNGADNGGSSPLGAGAREVTIQGLDASGNEISEAVVTAGASASAQTTATFFRVYRAWVSSTGTYTGNNTAAIVIENGTGGTDLISIQAGEGQSQFCGYTIPTGKVGYLASIMVQADAAKAADFRLFTRANAGDVTAPFSAKRLRLFWDGVLGQSFVARDTPTLVIPALTDIWMEARGGGAGTEVSADMEIWLFDV